MDRKRFFFIAQYTKLHGEHESPSKFGGKFQILKILLTKSRCVQGCFVWDVHGTQLPSHTSSESRRIRTLHELSNGTPRDILKTNQLDMPGFHIPKILKVSEDNFRTQVLKQHHRFPARLQVSYWVTPFTEKVDQPAKPTKKTSGCFLCLWTPTWENVRFFFSPQKLWVKQTPPKNEGLTWVPHGPGAIFDGNLDFFGDTEGTQVNHFGRGSEKVISRISAGEIREIFVCKIFHLVGFVTGKQPKHHF